MRINQTKNNPNFNGIYNNKFLLSNLETIAQHSASFSAGAMFIGSTIIRPLAISLTPKVKEDNKKILSIESISSGIAKLIIALGVSLPIENVVKKIDKKNIKNKDNYDFLAQIVKLSSNLISAIPKSILGVALIPIIIDLINSKKKPIDKKETTLNNISFSNFKDDVSFKVNKASEFVSSIINSKRAQEFATKHIKNKDNIARNMSILTDVTLTSGSILATKMSKKIKKEDKKPLISNKILCSTISIFAGYSIDKIVQKLGKNIVENFKNANLNNPKLAKYLEGINILRPTIIFACIYYGLIPIFTTYLSDKISNMDSAKQKEI